MADEINAASMKDSPMTIFQGAAGAAALKAALDLEVFTRIAHGEDSVDALAKGTQAPARSMRILCDALTVFGVLNKSAGRYSLPPLSQALLVKGSATYLGGMSRIITSQAMFTELGRLGDIVRAGHTLLDQHAETADNPFWQEFARGSRQLAQISGPRVAELAAEAFKGRAEPKRILDIACGSGFYGIAALKRFAGARLVQVDWPGVIPHAQANAKEAGVADRIEFRPGDIFAADLGAGYDLILAVNIYHHFSIAKNAELSARLAGAAASGATLIIVDMVPDEAREKERFALTFALTMLIMTRDGDTYTLSEYKRMLEPSGWRDAMLKVAPGPVPLQAIVARKS
jgi:SAM-dependent methyltransferase